MEGEEDSSEEGEGSRERQSSKGLVGRESTDKRDRESKGKSKEKAQEDSERCWI